MSSYRTLHPDGHRPRRPRARPDLRFRHHRHVAEQWGRRWITIDTSRVALNIRHGFVYERVPHITLKSIANNAEIDVIWDKWQKPRWSRCARS
jgi:hypothetical protein